MSDNCRKEYVLKELASCEREYVDLSRRTVSMRIERECLDAKLAKLKQILETEFPLADSKVEDEK